MKLDIPSTDLHGYRSQFPSETAHLSPRSRSTNVPGAKLASGYTTKIFSVTASVPTNHRLSSCVDAAALHDCGTAGAEGTLSETADMGICWVPAFSRSEIISVFKRELCLLNFRAFRRHFRPENQADKPPTMRPSSMAERTIVNIGAVRPKGSGAKLISILWRFAAAKAATTTRSGR